MSAIFAELFNRLKWSKVDIDNVPFKMYSRVTVGLFLVASVASVFKDYWGEPITCKDADKIAEALCWTHGTYHIENTGFTNGCSYTEEKKGNDTKDTAYYVWVSLMLFIHGATFMIPNILWKYLEGGWMKKLKLTEDREEEDAKKHAVNTAILLKSKSIKWTQKYFFTFIIFEYLNFAIAVATFFIIDRFLSGKFSTYGSEAVQYLTESNNNYKDNRANPMCNAFPTTVSCPFESFGVNGLKDTKNDICALTPNLANQYIYLVLWFWLILLFVASSIWTVFRIVTFCSEGARREVIKRKVETTKPDKVNNLDLSLKNVGQWFIIGQICRNLSTEYAREFLAEMNRGAKKEEDGSTENSTKNEKCGIKMNNVALKIEDEKNTLMSKQDAPIEETTSN